MARLECLVCLSIAAALLCSPARAEAQLTRKGVVIVGKGSGKCVHIPDRSPPDGSLVQSTCASDSTRWELVRSGNHVRVVAERGRECLSRLDGAPSSHGAVVHARCAGRDSELWAVKPYGRHYRLVAKGTGRCLNVKGGSARSNAELVLAACGGEDRGLFTFGGEFVGPEGHVRLVSTRQRLCAELSERSEVVLSPCRTGAARQLWSVQPSPGGTRLSPAGPGQASRAGSWPIQESGRTVAIAGGPSEELQISTEHELGSWSPVVPLPLVPVGAAALRDGKVLFWSAYDEYTFGGNNGRTQTAIFDPQTGSVVSEEVSNTRHDMFCPGTALLADGRLLVNGGSSSSRTSIYNPSTGTWSTGGVMNVSRGYNASTLLANGRVFTIGGSWSGGRGGKLGEVWTSSTRSWSRRQGIPAAPMTAPDPAGVYRGDNHAWLFSTGAGRVFHAGPSVEMNWFDTAGSGSFASAGRRGTDRYSMCGSAVMYDVHRILKLGGAPAYDRAGALTQAYVIDIRSGVSVAETGSLAFARIYQNSVVLPDGRVFVAGGQAFGAPFSDAQSVLAGEIWSEKTHGFTTVASAAIPRNYHSIALLLPDARVLVGGGGLCGTGCEENHADLEFYSPGYLFDPSGLPAARPVIVSAPGTAGYDATIEVTTSEEVARFVFIRMGSVTHTVNNDQRRIPATTAGRVGTTYSVNTPADSGIAPPGYYMLFALSSSDVPSVAAILRIGS